MDWRWDWLWSILWSAFIHLITGQWSALARDGDSFKSWWRSLWSEIEATVNRAKSWLSGYAFGLYVQAINWINDKIAWVTGRLSWLQGYAFGLYVQAVNWINDRINWLRGHAEWLVNAARAFAQWLANEVRAFARSYVDYWRTWLYNTFQWIQPLRDLIANWLTGARAVVDWLWHYAWGQLQAFLSNPIGFVLGWLLTPIVNLINWWQKYGSLLMTFVANELVDLYNLWNNGKLILAALVSDPQGFIFDLLAPKFLDWAAGVIADNW